MSKEDTQFLNASLELERRELEDALKSHTFKFQNGEASSVSELITLCDNYPSEAEDYLFNGYLETWLVGQGKTDLANMLRKAVSLYGLYKREQERALTLKMLHNQKLARRQGLEMFVRELCKNVGVDGYPKIFTQPDRLDLGEMPVGFQKRVQLKISNNWRGIAWGKVTVESYLPGVRVPPEFNSTDITLDIGVLFDF